MPQNGARRGTGQLPHTRLEQHLRAQCPLQVEPITHPIADPKVPGGEPDLLPTTAFRFWKLHFVDVVETRFRPGVAPSPGWRTDGVIARVTEAAARCPVAAPGRRRARRMGCSTRHSPTWPAKALWDARHQRRGTKTDGEHRRANEGYCPAEVWRTKRSFRGRKK